MTSMENIGLFDLSKCTDDGPLVLMPWARECYGVQTSDELLNHLETEGNIAIEGLERLMAEMDEHDRLMAELED